MHPSAVLYESASVVNNQEDDAISVGAHTHVRGELLTFGHGGAIQVGEYCYVGEQTRIWSARRISIGNRVLIAHQVNIFDNSTHPLGPRERHEQFRMIITSGQPKSIDLGEMPVTIEDDAWIGCMSIVLPGVTIGAAAVVGAGSVVTESVAPYTVVAGNPARFVRKIERNG